MLNSHIRTRLQDRGILLMTHIVLGYPSFADSLRLIQTMVEAGVDLMELQIPFSEPIADGPVILKTTRPPWSAGPRWSSASPLPARPRPPSPSPSCS